MTRQEYLKHKEVIDAWAGGAEIEYKTSKGKWIKTDSPSWCDSNEYRVKSAKPTYFELHEKCELKVGDKVRIVRKWDESEQNCCLHFNRLMEDTVNKIGTIKKKESGFYNISVSNDIWSYPYFVLEKYVEEYIPFTFEDDLVGKIVKTVGKTSKVLIVAQQEDWISVDDFTHTYQELLNEFTFLDGSPCGKLKQ